MKNIFIVIGVILFFVIGLWLSRLIFNVVMNSNLSLFWKYMLLK